LVGGRGQAAARGKIVVVSRTEPNGRKSGLILCTAGALTATAAQRATNAQSAGGGANANRESWGEP